MSWQGETTLEGSMPARRSSDDTKAEALALVVVWAPRDAARLGEVLFPKTGAFFGRGPVEDQGDARVGLLRQRPKENVDAAPIEEPFLSRKHLVFEVDDDAVEVKVVGRRPLRVGETSMQVATIREGDVVEIEGLTRAS